MIMLRKCDATILDGLEGQYNPYQRTSLHMCADTINVIDPPFESPNVRITGEDIHYMKPINHFGCLSKR
jgi:hypothetical protein